MTQNNSLRTCKEDVGFVRLRFRSNDFNKQGIHRLAHSVVLFLKIVAREKKIKQLSFYLPYVS